MTKQFKWFNTFYSDDQKAKLAERAKTWNPEDQKRIEKEWNMLFADVRMHMDKAPNQPEVLILVERWEALLGQVYPRRRGDPGPV